MLDAWPFYGLSMGVSLRRVCVALAILETSVLDTQTWS